MPYCMECKKYYNVGVRCPYCGSLINEETNTKGPVIKISILDNSKENLIFDGKTLKEKKEENEKYQKNKLNE
jgi:hypothetical protein